MEHYTVVSGIQVVAVALPVSLPDVYLYITPNEVPFLRDEQGVQEVRPNTRRWSPRIKDMKYLPLDCDHILECARTPPPS